MVRWFKLDLGDAMLAQAQFAELKDQLTAIYNRLPTTAETQAFSRYESQELHCHLMLYFTADLHDESLFSAATECSAPQLNGAEFLFK